MRIDQVTITHPDAALLIDAVQQEYVALYGGPDESPIDHDEFAPGHGLFVVGYLDDEPVATGAWRWHTPVDEVTTGPTVEIKRMYVAAGHRGRGHARAILAHLEQTAYAAGAAAMILETGTLQPEAMALYESSGYRPVAGFGYYRDSDLSRCYAKLLG
ncbi:GCN5-related N-acetyltransferase [metagenome]|uniref:GCN5-related N-acetyltransferase n=1 Tax=metagenome TaxID=256318 RepID=A0A2P2C622_9ZZZZ